MYFIISQLTPRGVGVVVINENRQLSCPSWASFRFIRRRGVICYIDLFLQHGVAKLAEFKHKSFGLPAAGDKNIQREPFNPERPFEFRRTLAILSHLGVGENRLVEWHDVDAVNSDAAVALLKSANADFILLCGAPIVKVPLFRGAGKLINAHCGICPQYKGSSPMHWAAYNRDWDNFGFTLHVVSSGIDGGPIIHQERHRPRPGWNLPAFDWYLVHAMYQRLCQLIVEGQLAEMIGRAVEQPRGIASHPPMGLLRSAIASRRLRRYLAARSDY